MNPAQLARLLRRHDPVFVVCPRCHVPDQAPYSLWMAGPPENLCVCDTCLANDLLMIPMVLDEERSKL